MQDDAALAKKIEDLNASEPSRKPVQPAQHAPTPPPPAPESEDDDPSLEVPAGATCKRKTCGATYKKGSSRDAEECIHHPGIPIFHEGSKGYSCCKRRVLEFDQFMKIEGCKTKSRHLFVGSGKKASAGAGVGDEEVLSTVRYVSFLVGPSSTITDTMQTRFLPNTHQRHRLVLPQKDQQGRIQD